MIKADGRTESLFGPLMGKKAWKLDGLTIAAFFVICAGGSLIQAVCGFGFGVFTMMFLPHMMPSTLSAVMVTSLLGMSSSAIVSWRHRRHIQMRKVVIPLLAYFVFSTYMVQVSISTNETLIRRLLGALMIILSVYFIRFSNKVHIRPTKINAVIAGSLGGTMSTLFGMGGPPISAYYLSATDTNEEYLANIQTYTVLGNLYVNGVRAANGLFSQRELVLWAIGIFAVFFGSYLGKRIFSRLDGYALRRLVYAFMAVSGVIMLLKR